MRDEMVAFQGDLGFSSADQRRSTRLHSLFLAV